MKHRATPKFWAAYHKLPAEIQQLADRCFALLEANHSHPSLHFKPLFGQIWSARVGNHYRALTMRDGNECAWFWIGTHAEYDSIIAR